MKNPTLSYLLATIASVATVLLPICAFAAPQILFESDFQSGTIFKFTPDGTRITFASGLSGPGGLALDASGNLFETNEQHGGCRHIQVYTTKALGEIFPENQGSSPI